MYLQINIQILRYVSIIGHSIESSINYITNKRTTDAAINVSVQLHKRLSIWWVTLLSFLLDAVHTDSSVKICKIVN